MSLIYKSGKVWICIRKGDETSVTCYFWISLNSYEHSMWDFTSQTWNEPEIALPIKS